MISYYRRSPLFRVMIKVGIIILASVVIYYVLIHKMGSKEDAARLALRDLCAAQAIFYNQDRDENGARDFWIGDIAGLYAIPGKDGNRIGLIPIELAKADSAPLKHMDGSPVPYHGYYFRAMELGNYSGGEPKEEGVNDGFQRDRDPKQFGFCCYPARYGETGVFTYFIGERLLGKGGEPWVPGGESFFGVDFQGQVPTHWPDKKSLMGKNKVFID